MAYTYIAVAVVSLFLSFITIAVIAFVAKHRSLADLKKVPGPKPSILFGNALQLVGEPHGKFKEFSMTKTMQMHVRDRVKRPSITGVLKLTFESSSGGFYIVLNLFEKSLLMQAEGMCWLIQKHLDEVNQILGLSHLNSYREHQSAMARIDLIFPL